MGGHSPAAKVKGPGGVGTGGGAQNGAKWPELRVVEHGDLPLGEERLDLRGLALWMLLGALQTTGDAHQDLALALEQLLPRRYWRQALEGADPTLGPAD